MRAPSWFRTQRLAAFSSVCALIFSSSAFIWGQSPAKPGDEVDHRIDSILSRMTLEEKVAMVGGIDSFYIRGYERLGLPRIRMSDGPLGVRNYGPSTAMTAGIGLAASWDPQLAESVGSQIGRDARARGVHFMLGPGVNIYRAPMNGRNFEYFGEDPFLGLRMAVGYIVGMQSEGVSATVKHFLGNNSEFDRHNTDSLIDERTMREIYLPIFEAAVKEGRVGAVMDSYNLINGEHATENTHNNIDILKNEWGFQGVLMSDWDATYDGVKAANGGLDLEMPSAKFMTPAGLMAAIQGGIVSQATLDDKIRRILRDEITFGWIDRNQTDDSIPSLDPEGARVALAEEVEGIVLLKNDGHLLPLSKAKTRSVLVVGPDAFPGVPVGGGSAQVKPFNTVSYLEGLSSYLSPSTKVFYSPGVPTLSQLARGSGFTTAASGGEPGLQGEYFSGDDLQGSPAETSTEKYIDFGPPDGWVQSLGRTTGPPLPENSKSQRWTGYYSPKAAGRLEFFVASTGEDGGYYRLYVDDKLVLDDWNHSYALVGKADLALDPQPHKVVLEHHGQSRWIGGHLRMGVVDLSSVVLPDAKTLARKADAVVLAIGYDPETESEGADRSFALPPGQDALIEAMASQNRNTIAVLTSGGNADTSAWLDRVPAFIEAWYPGQEGGRALAEILVGDVNPSGRLPVTFERKWEDNPVHDSYYPPPGTNRVDYKEGVFVGYRGYERNGTRPLYPFGYGLSYTEFEYSNLQIRPIAMKLPAGSDPGPRFEVSFDVKNSGAREGADVAQVYVGEPDAKLPRPEKELKGFSRVSLKPGETKRVAVLLDSRSFDYFDTGRNLWRADPGNFIILVGRSSDQVVLKGKITLTAQEAEEATHKP
jgi:beta-glucosidase